MAHQTSPTQRTMTILIILIIHLFPSFFSHLQYFFNKIDLENSDIIQYDALNINEFYGMTFYVFLIFFLPQFLENGPS
jgi:hypothetical protein